MSDEVLVSVDGVSKKFCRSLKRSLWYGLRDVGSEILGRGGRHDELRKNEFWAVNDVSFELKRGECLGLIGPNGAGKSTLLKLLNGLVKPDKGRITMRGRVGALIELGAGFNPILTARENIYVNGSVLGFTKKEINTKFDEIVDFAQVEEFIDTPVQNYSSGMRVRLGFAVAALLKPEVLLIDEVLAVGDARFRMKCYEHLLRLKADGTSILVVSHAVNHLSRVATRCIVLSKGFPVYIGDVQRAIGEYEKELLGCREKLEEKSSASVAIESVHLTDTNGRRSGQFLTGDTIQAEITCNTTICIENARLIVAIESPTLGVLGSVSTPFLDFSFDVNPPKTRIRLVLPGIPLLVGAYYLNVSLYGPAPTEFHARSAPAVVFQVVGPPTDEFGFGLANTFAFSHRWSLVENAATEDEI